MESLIDYNYDNKSLMQKGKDGWSVIFIKV